MRYILNVIKFHVTKSNIYSNGNIPALNRNERISNHFIFHANIGQIQIETKQKPFIDWTYMVVSKTTFQLE